MTDRAEDIRQGFEHLQAADPVLAVLIGQHPDYDPDAWRLELPVMDLFGCLVLQIIGQQISIKSAQAIMRRLSGLFGGRIPSPQDIGTLSDQQLRDVGFTWRKAATVLELAAQFADGRLSEGRLSALSDDEMLAELTQISGIGPWTVHGALLIYLRRDNVVPTGDIMLRSAVKRYYNMRELPTEPEFSAIAEHWRPYQSLGVNLLFAAVEFNWPERDLSAPEHAPEPSLALLHT